MPVGGKVFIFADGTGVVGSSTDGEAEGDEDGEADGLPVGGQPPGKY